MLSQARRFSVLPRLELQTAARGLGGQPGRGHHQHVQRGRHIRAAGERASTRRDRARRENGVAVAESARRE